MSKKPVRVAVTGAAGQIGYALLFRIASGEMLGKDQPVILQLLDLPQAMKACQGVIMELDDCAFPLLAGVFATDDPNVAFKDADVCLLVGARPRGPGMERADLLTSVSRFSGGASGEILHTCCEVASIEPAFWDRMLIDNRAFIDIQDVMRIADCNFTEPLGILGDDRRDRGRIAEEHVRIVLHRDERIAHRGGSRTERFVQNIGKMGTTG
jgi:hypothetical protein